MRGPNSRRAGRRRISAASTAAASARLSRRTRAASSLIVVELRDQGFQVRDVLGAQRPVLGEVGDQRGHLAAEQAVDQVLALGLDVGLAADQRAVEVAAVLAAALDGLLAQEAGDERLDRARRPAGGL